MAKKLRMGAVGVGGIWEWCHAQAWRSHPEVEIVAICDVVKEKADRWAKETGGKAYYHHEDMLKDADLDFIDVCTPNLYHSLIAVAGLKAGLHVFTEKPDAINVREAQKMADAARNSGKTLMAMRNNRWLPQSKWMKQYIDAGSMGEIYTGRCGWQRRRGAPGKGGWFTTKAISGGGPLIDLGVHFIDVASWLMGDPKPVAVSGCTYRKFVESGVSDSEHAKFGSRSAGAGTFDVEDLAIGFIRFANGASLQIEFSWSSNIENENAFVELRGTKAGAKLDWGGLKVFTEGPQGLYDIQPKLEKNPRGDHAMMLHHFVDVIQKRAKPIMTPQDGANMIQILQAMYESADKGREVRV